jgi:hypothetical protein
MALRSLFWSLNQRLQRAAVNNRPMHAFDPDSAAVRLLQQALAQTGFEPAIKVDGVYGPKTAAALRKVEARFNMDRDDGVAGRQTLGILDILLQGGVLGRDLALTDVPLATRKVRAALSALNVLKINLKNGTGPNQLTADALLTHFRLSVGPSTFGVARQATERDVDEIIFRYNQLLGLFAAGAVNFSTGVPVNGILTAAEAPLNGPIRFGPAFTDVDSNFGDRIGDNSRAAVLIHEAVHVFDVRSGDLDTHISEFDPAYDSQTAERSLRNPSSFAGFAAHIDNKGDPKPRFGLGPGARGL